MASKQLDPQIVSNALASIRNRLSDEQVDVLSCDFSSNQLISVVAVAGAGKTRTAASLVVECMLNKSIRRIVVMTSMRSAANTALVRVGEILETSGLSNIGMHFPSECVRTIHSLARSANKFSGRPYFITNRVDDYIEKAIDDVLSPHRLARFGVDSFATFWRDREGLVQWAANTEEMAKEIVKEHPNCCSEFHGLELYKALFRAADPALESAGFGETKQSHLVSSLRSIRKELLDRCLHPSITDTAKAEIIARANKLMEEDKVVDHSGSIHSFAASKEPVCGSGDLLLVDESQDLTKAQQIIALTALRSGACVVLIGDQSQAITYFAGASSNPIFSMQKEAEEGGFVVKRFKLTVNYRSSSAIVRASEAVLPEADQQARGRVTAMFSGDPVQLVFFPNEQDEARRVGRMILECVQKGGSHKEIAVLSYKNITWNDPLCEVLRNLHVPFTIRGMGKDTACPAGRVLPALQVGLGVEEFATDLEDEVNILQSFVRALHGCSFTDEVRGYVIEVATKRQVKAVDAYLHHTQDILDLTELAHPSPWSGKRDLFGNKLLGRNTRKSNITKATMTAKAAIDQMAVWLLAASEGQSGVGGIYSPVGVPLVKAGMRSGFSEPSCAPQGAYVPTTPLASVAHAVATSYLKINPTRINEYNDLLKHLDSRQDEDCLDSWVGSVGEQLAKLQEQEENKVVCLSTMHRFKGSERDHVFVIRFNAKFDYVKVSESTMEAYSALHESAFKAKHQQILELTIAERKRVAHVALSRARKTLTVSVTGELGSSATALRAVV